jgi:transposase-like protein
VNASTSPTETTTTAAATTATIHPKKRTRTCWSEQDKTECLALFAQSGLSAADFCGQLGISPATFSLWRRTERGEVSAPVASATQFAQVCVTEADTNLRAPQAMAGPTAVMIHLPGGAKLEAPVGIDPAWLAQVVKRLAGV